jgi:hypothetical protein
MRLDEMQSVVDMLTCHDMLMRVLTDVRCNGLMVQKYQHVETEDEPGVARVLGRALELVVRHHERWEVSDVTLLVDSLMVFDRWRHCLDGYDFRLSLVCALILFSRYSVPSESLFELDLYSTVAAAAAHPDWPFPTRRRLSAAMLQSGLQTTVDLLCTAAFDPNWLQIACPDTGTACALVENLIASRPPLLNFFAAIDALVLPSFEQ